MPKPVTNIREEVRSALSRTRIFDIHTHLVPSRFGLLWGIKKLLLYHYLLSEYHGNPLSTFSIEQMQKIDEQSQVNMIWQEHFLRQSPTTEAATGVITVLNELGLDVPSRDLAEYCRWFDSKTVEEQVDRVLELANIEALVMTNDPFDDNERRVWLEEGNDDPRFIGALRLDGLLFDLQRASGVISDLGYVCDYNLTDPSVASIRKFLKDWIEKIKAVYLAASFTPDFCYPDRKSVPTPTGQLIDRCILPTCQEMNIPFALMIGVKRQINPRLGLAGDGVGRFDLDSLIRLCGENGEVKFLATLLSAENQYELAVMARKFGNLHPFGCWWWLNTRSHIQAITDMRLELWPLEKFTPNHSDARVLEQLIYKWQLTLKVLEECLTRRYEGLSVQGWRISREEIQRDVKGLLGGNFKRFVGFKN